MANCIIITGGTWNDEDWSKIQRSVGPYRVASALEDAGYSTFVFDYIINFSTEEIKKVLDEAVNANLLNDTKVKDALKKLLAARKRNPEDENAHDMMEQYLIQLYFFLVAYF